MAIALENANLVRQKVKIALANASPAIQEQFAVLLRYLATQKKNIDLQFIPYSEAQIIANGGYSPDVDGNKLYGFYGKASRTTGTTAAFVNLHAATSNGATTTTIATQRLLAAGQVFAHFWPEGMPCETELTISAATAVGGATESTTPDGADGFVIIGAA